MLYLFYIFFFKQKTAYEMRISDWSSDVCSSDLFRGNRPHVPFEIGAEEQQFIALEFGDILAFVERPQVVHERSAATEILVRAGDGRAPEIRARRRSRQGSPELGRPAAAPRMGDSAGREHRKIGLGRGKDMPRKTT